jgi:predicted NUDIX family NTP pyrophosphohydrolase
MEPRERTVPKQSAGIVLFKRAASGLRVLLVHPGGPFWAARDLGAWTVPKGEIEPGEEPLAAALREFAEETGGKAAGTPVALPAIRQAGGKVVSTWAVEGDFDVARLASGSFEVEWPPRSGRKASFPEVDRAAWFTLEEAARKILPSQKPILDSLRATIGAQA